MPSPRIIITCDCGGSEWRLLYTESGYELRCAPCGRPAPGIRIEKDQTVCRWSCRKEGN